MASNKLVIPTLGEDMERWKKEIKAWSRVTNVTKADQGVHVALALPTKHSSNIREKVFDQYDELQSLQTETGLTALLEFITKHLGKDNISDSWQKFETFDNLSRKPEQDFNSFISDFDDAYTRLKNVNFIIPSPFLAFKLLKSANIGEDDKKIVLTDVSFDEKDLQKMFDNTKKALQKYKGCTAISNNNEREEAIKVLMAASSGNRFRGRPTTPRFKGNASPRGKFKRNPLGSDGLPLRCHTCDSMNHLYANCPDKEFVKFSETEEDCSLFYSDEAVNKIVLYCEKNNDVQQLTKEASQCAVLDSGCTSTVCGRKWFSDYVATLPDNEAAEITHRASSKVFKFGSGEENKSSGCYRIPATIANKQILIDTDVVESDIPLLLSKESMKRAAMKLDLQNDRAEVLGHNILLNITSSGHYCLPIVHEVFAVNIDGKDQRKILGKLHRQFAHPTKAKLISLLKDAKLWNGDMENILDEIVSECDVCKIYKRTPCKPSVALPMAEHFNDKVAMDLKQWNGRFILHLVDMWSRFSVSIFINRKRPSEIIDAILRHWVGAGYGIMKGILCDNGGEFTSDEMKEVCSILNVETLSTAANSPFQNGLCERNHAVVDLMLLKLCEQCPRTPVEILLCWAVNAKNSLQMWHGFSSYQLVFGRNPNLPNVMHEGPPALDGKTTSDTLARHLNALHEARKAFVESEASERIRRALRSKITASEERFSNGDLVYYKREGKEKWLGPGKVVFQDGKVIFVRHQNSFVRVSPNRLIKANYLFRKPSESDADDTRGGEFEKEVRQANPEDVAEETDSSDHENEPQNDGEEIPHDRGADRGEQVQHDVETGPRRSLRNTVRHNYAEVDTRGFEIPEEQSELYFSFNPKSEKDQKPSNEAKMCELENWRKFDVYSEVKDRGQPFISTRWVMSKKIDGSKTTVKARLVARGFEESTPIQCDSPTAAKETLRIMLSLSSSLSWSCQTIDIKAAFLQSKEIDREVYLCPPKEANAEGLLWKLKKTVYGLSDASRSWYNSVRDELLKLKCSQSRLDPAMFYKQDDDHLVGLFIMHVDDFIWAGTETFKCSVIQKLTEKFQIGKSASGNFRYIGLDVEQNDSGIVVDQQSYVNSDAESIPLSRLRSFDRDKPLVKDETRELRGLVGKLNWLSTQTRPDVSFDVLELSTRLNSPTVNDILRANKALRLVLANDCKLSFPRLGSLDRLKIVVHSDASFGNLNQGVGSAAGYVVFLVGENGRCCPLAWKSNKIKRVVRSTLAAETLALVDSLEDACYLRKILLELLHLDSIPIDCYTDNKSLVENIHSTKSVHDKKLRIDTACLKEMLKEGEISSLSWLDSKNQLADCLTKTGASSQGLREVLSSGRFPETIKS